MSNHVLHVNSCPSCQIMSFMSNHVIQVKSCRSCQIMSFMSNHVLHVKSCHSCQIMSFMSNHVIHVKSCRSCQIMSFMSNHVIRVKSCQSFVIWAFSEQTFSKVGREGGREVGGSNIATKALVPLRPPLVSTYNARPYTTAARHPRPAQDAVQMCVSECRDALSNYLSAARLSSSSSLCLLHKVWLNEVPRQATRTNA
jgi:hypothetical protein